MSMGIELLREHKYRELWQRYCGFIDLSLQDFMGIQRHLLLEQIELLKRCELGSHILNGAWPNTVEEFRQQVPLTTYSDYAPYLLELREDSLPAQPLLWQRTSGISGEHDFKWAPITKRMYEEMRAVVFSSAIFATCKDRYDIRLEEGEKTLYALAPPPYATGCWGRLAAEEMLASFLPPLDESEAMSFEERVTKGIQEGLSQGIDMLFGLPSVLVALGERIGQRGKQHQNQNLLSLLRRPKALLRILRGLLKSRLARRSLRPKDLWSIRGVITAGTDSSFYRQRIKERWGSPPLDVYGSTETVVIATQTWDYKAMTFLPHLNFLEFIPESEHFKAKLDPRYHPRTVLLDEVEAGQNYELVITNFLGGAFVRYRMGDMVTIVAQRNEKLNIDIPQMVFYSRADDIIALAGFTRLTEKTLWEAVERAEIPCKGWIARKEIEEISVLHLYLELGDGAYLSDDDVRRAIHHQLGELHKPYAEMEEMLGLKPLKITLLPKGSFRSYSDRQRAAGADLVHLKPPHINPSDAVLESLLQAAVEPEEVAVA